MNHLFPDCTIHTMPQRSPEWHEIRKDKLTASGMGAWLAEEPVARITVDEIKVILDRFAIPYKKSGAKPELLALLPPEMLPRPTLTQGAKDARHTAICRILGAMSNCAVPDQWEVDPDGPPPRNPALWAVWNGIRQEAAAVKAFEEWSGETIIEVGFCEHKSGVAGCSPDGLIDGNPYGFEGKAPLPATHVRYLLDGVLPSEYADQVHASMAITGAEGWHFQSYCPGLPAFRIFVMRDDYTERMVAGLAEFAGHLESARDEIAALWDAEFTKEGEQ
jgi:hypothetical protein